jgi:hypothetical protein
MRRREIGSGPGQLGSERINASIEENHESPKNENPKG